MTEREAQAILKANHQGELVPALVTRPGGKFRTIHKLVKYYVSKTGALLYFCDVMPCVANRSQYEYLESLTGGKYITGRPTKAEALGFLKPARVEESKEC